MEDFRSLIETNFWGPVRMIRAVLPHLRSQRSGVIVNVGSIAGVVPGTPYNGPYGASKHALSTLSETVQNEVGPFGVRVVCIEPGFFATEINANSAGRHGAGGITDTEYQADYEWFDSFMNSGVEEGADPAIVAARIVDATEQEIPLHQPLGDDALMYKALLAEVDSFEAWMDVAVPIVEAQAGPRPEPPPA
jgi:NAD(P)-dependent dehydrogenase (short-subunit alcohol dehydrogenase family)